uniref:Uncharacterized protein n=1 Tax=Amphimedon queenslandica TaxID=400682 RepID=A0A1X7UGA3_AMPQE
MALTVSKICWGSSNDTSVITSGIRPIVPCFLTPAENFVITCLWIN